MLSSSNNGAQRPTPTFPQLTSQMFERSALLPDFTCLTLESHKSRRKPFLLFSKYPQFLIFVLPSILNLARLSLHWSGQIWQALGHKIPIFCLVWSWRVASSAQSALLLCFGLSASLKVLRINLHDLCSTSRPLFTKSNLVVAGASAHTASVGALVDSTSGCSTGASDGSSMNGIET